MNSRLGGGDHLRQSNSHRTAQAIARTGERRRTPLGGACAVIGRAPARRLATRSRRGARTRRSAVAYAAPASP
jgi:hypothetical protein